MMKEEGCFCKTQPLLLPSVSDSRKILTCLFYPYSSITALFGPSLLFYSEVISLSLFKELFHPQFFPVLHNHHMVLTQIWSVKKIIIFEKIASFTSPIMSFICLSLILISFFVAKVRSLLCIQDCFCINRSYHFFTFSLNSKISMYIYYSLLDGFKEGHIFDSYLLCFCFYYPFLSLFLCIKIWNFLFFAFFGGVTCALCDLKGHWFIFVSILNLLILIFFCHLLCWSQKNE